MRAFTYQQGDSFLHRLNPTVKLVAIIAVTVAITFVLDVVTPLVFLLVSLFVTVVLGRISMGYVARSMAPFIYFALSFVVINTLFHRDIGPVTPILTIGPLTISWEGLQLGLSIGLRVLFLISTSLMLVATTKPGDLVLSLTQQARLNYKLAYAILAAYRFVPILAAEYDNIRAAGEVRGARARGGMLAGLQNLRREVIPLLAGAIRRSERMAVAMDSRAFGAYPQRTYHKRLAVTRSDWAFLLGVLVVSAAIFALLSYTGLISGVGVQLEQPPPTTP
jgi:energy-coupling factor transport system permease protein